MSIELRELSKSFDGRPVLTSLNHTFPGGKITCIVGPSGCGKTTLLSLLMGLLSPDGGEILGLPSGRIAAVFQEDRLIEHLSTVSNIRLVLRRGFPEEEILDALESVGLKDAARQPVRELSGGMKRRAAIVRALLADSPLVLMDEPFKGLDAATRETVIRFTRRCLSGRTALIVTHDPDEAKMLGADIFNMKSDGASQ